MLAFAPTEIIVEAIIPELATPQIFLQVVFILFPYVARRYRFYVFDEIYQVQARISIKQDVNVVALTT
jgi:hypothetical protein